MQILKTMLCLALLGSAAHAAPVLHTDAQGKLTGADGVLVNGQLFDVRFVEGSFVGIFGDASGLDATSAQQALDFSAALGDQVFNEDNPVFDGDSGTTHGCNNNWRPWCYIYTPFADLMGLQLSVGYFLNQNGATSDSIGTTATNRNINTATVALQHGDYVYADWSDSLEAEPLPAAPSLLLLGLGLVGLGVYRRLDPAAHGPARS